MEKFHGLFRAMGRRISRGWKTLGMFGAGLMAKHRERSSFQRSIFAATIAGVLAGGALGAGWNVSSRMLADWQTPIKMENEGIVARLDAGDGISPLASTAPERQEVEGPVARQPMLSARAEQPRQPAAPSSERTPSVTTSDRSPQTGGAFHPKVDAVPINDLPAPSVDERMNGAVTENDAAEATLSVAEMIWPVSGSIVRPFGWYRHPVFGDWRYTTSLALETTEDDRVVRAALDGRVKDVVNEGGLWRITVEHAGGMISEYEGLLAIHVASYEPVDTGKQLGVAPAPGAGRAVAFSLWSDGTPIDPQTIIDGPGLPVLAR